MMLQNSGSRTARFAQTGQVISLMVLVLLTGCQTYRAVDPQEIVAGRLYIFTLDNGQTLSSFCEQAGPEVLTLKVNGASMQLPRTKIVKVDKKRVSLVKAGIIAAATTAGVLLLLDYAKKPIGQLPPGNDDRN